MSQETIPSNSDNDRTVKSNFVWLWLTAVIILLDQISKYLVKSSIDYGEIIKVTPKLFWLTHIRNTGAAFSLSLGDATLNKAVFIAVSSLASLLLIFLIKKAVRKMEVIAYALILGGAIGNLIDRIFFGAVTDFLWLDFPDFIMHRWPVFNLADSSIVIAIVILVLYTLFWEKKKGEE